jgi:hypothetical protein
MTKRPLTDRPWRCYNGGMIHRLAATVSTLVFLATVAGAAPPDNTERDDARRAADACRQREDPCSLVHLDKACALGDGPSCRAAGNLRWLGVEGVSRDRPGALPSFRAGCTLNDAASCGRSLVREGLLPR